MLYELNVSCNQLQTLPESLSQASRLSIFDASGNRWTVRPEWLDRREWFRLQL